MKFEIRKAGLGDLNDILSLNKKLFDLEVKSGFDSSLDPNWTETEEANKEITDRISSEDSCGFVVVLDSVVVGYLIGLILEEETGRSESKYAELEHMFVDDDYRGQGTGKELVEEFRKWAKDKGLSKIKVNVSFRNDKAINFYKKIGLDLVDVTLVEKV